MSLRPFKAKERLYPTAEHLDLITRWYALRKLRLVPALLQEGQFIWTFTNPHDPWGSRNLLHFYDFVAMVEQAELLLAKKEPAKETLAAKDEEKTA